LPVCDKYSGDLLEIEKLLMEKFSFPCGGGGDAPGVAL
jgi:hypothetical protein